MEADSRTADPASQASTPGAREQGDQHLGSGPQCVNAKICEPLKSCRVLDGLDEFGNDPSVYLQIQRGQQTAHSEWRAILGDVFC